MCIQVCCSFHAVCIFYIVYLFVLQYKENLHSEITAFYFSGDASSNYIHIRQIPTGRK